ncbi:rhombosortase [Aquirhabdus parva]|uniref:rhombosortase n=1 Tax=Aquirhabdus parva TaxID=2283318 RepID=UPI0013B3E73B|nr:rhombosortase [Aquirhabdus parva]
MLNRLKPVGENPRYRLRIVVYGAALLMTCCQFFFTQLVYIPSLLHAEPWRLWTGHWVHLGAWHWGLNAIALVLLPEIFFQASSKIFLFLWFALPVLISLLFFFFMPTLSLYAGLSGVLHGLYLVMALNAITSKNANERLMGWIVVLGLCLKVGWEFYSGNSQTAKLIGAPVILQAHQYGAGLGFILWLFILVWKRMRHSSL